MPTLHSNTPQNAHFPTKNKPPELPIAVTSVTNNTGDPRGCKPRINAHESFGCKGNHVRKGCQCSAGEHLQLLPRKAEGLPLEWIPKLTQHFGFEHRKWEAHGNKGQAFLSPVPCSSRPQGALRAPLKEPLAAREDVEPCPEY